MNKITKFFLSAAAVPAAICSCTKNNQNIVETAVSSDAEISVLVSTGESKATVRSDADDKAINSITVLVFDADGKVENVYSGQVGAEGKLNGTIKTSAGSKTIWAVANASSTLNQQITASTTLEQFLALETTLDEDNAPDSFLMTGSESGKSIVKGENTVTLTMKRLVARVEIHKITNGITAETDNILYDEKFSISSIFLINVPAKHSFKSETPTLWYNKRQNSNEAAGLLFDSVESELQKNSSYTQSHYFYCYPNAETSGNSGSTWAPCKTRLVIKAVYGSADTPTYYSIELPDTDQVPLITGIAANKTYSITSCTITRRGTDSPDQNTETGSISLSVTVTDWETGASYDYTI